MDFRQETQSFLQEISVLQLAQKRLTAYLKVPRKTSLL